VIRLRGVQSLITGVLKDSPSRWARMVSPWSPMVPLTSTMSSGCIRRGVTTWAIGEVVVIELTGSDAARRIDPVTGFELLELGG